MLRNAENEIRPMQYPVLAGGALPEVDLEPTSRLVLRVRELEAELAEREQQFERQAAAAGREAIEKGRQIAADEQAAWRTQCAQQLASALEAFRAQRDDYLSRVEHEVVRLALAIAARILHREAQMDPLLLSGAVRVALGQLADSTQARLRVPARHQDLWTEMLRLLPRLPIRPEVIADSQLGDTEAVLETSLGTIDLGIRAQLTEIERGFFDLLESRKQPGTDKLSGQM